MGKYLTPTLVACMFVLVFLGLFSLSKDLEEKSGSENIILAATSFGIETTVHKKFANELKRGTKLDQNSTVRIYLGPYSYLLRFDGLMASTPPDYYIFIDLHVYLSLDKKEIEALIAHELGHTVYKISFMDKLQLRIFSKFNIFNNRNSEIETKYQIQADRFSAEKTSPEAMISLLDQLYITRTEHPDYKMRIESLNKLKQGQVR